jgi:asparagine synthase (glutamine-hydrolysing)
LDHRIIEFAWTLPSALKQRSGRGKWLLRRVLYQYVPPALVDRPKKGFGVPIAAWLRGPLRAWASALLSENRLREEGIFDEEAVSRKWDEHVAEKRDWGQALWHVLMFQAWLEQQATAIPAPQDEAVGAATSGASIEVCKA